LVSRLSKSPNPHTPRPAEALIFTAREPRKVVLPHGAHKYGLLNDIAIGRDGLARCPQTPGIGAEIDHDLIRRKQITELA
jgi:L-alanine-DL-glutamate epimerase-like enolase superfamily enzyme